MAFTPTPRAKRFSPKTYGACSNQLRASLKYQETTAWAAVDWNIDGLGAVTPLGKPSAGATRKKRKKKTMAPARPGDRDPADPFFPERADHAIMETIEIATEGEDCDECVSRLGPVLKKIAGVKDVKADLQNQRVIVTFDARKTHPPDLHDAILSSGYKPGPVAD